MNERLQIDGSAALKKPVPRLITIEPTKKTDDDEWLMGAAVSATCLIKDGSSHQIRKGLANARARVTEGDFSVQQSIQHGVAELRLGFTVGKSSGGQQGFEYFIYLFVGVCP